MIEILFLVAKFRNSIVLGMDFIHLENEEGYGQMQGYLYRLGMVVDSMRNMIALHRNEYKRNNKHVYTAIPLLLDGNSSLPWFVTACRIVSTAENKAVFPSDQVVDADRSPWSTLPSHFCHCHFLRETTPNVSFDTATIGFGL